MKSIQSFKYKRKKLTVIFWNLKVWFNAIEILRILGYKDNITRFMGLLFGPNKDNLKFTTSKVKLISEDGLYVLTYYEGLKPKEREKANELYDYVQEEVMPAFNSYLRSWL